MTGRRYGEFWIGGTHRPGIAIDWPAAHGNARGTRFRLPSDRLDQLPPAP